MNTADRSIALLDTALRRRFDFEEMLPKLSLLENIEIEGINIKNLLESMNKRIEYLIDKNHMIGHSFFMGLNSSSTIKDLAHIFRFDIIPLLQEYFYDDTNKVRQVLNEMGTDEAHYFFVKDTDASEAFKKLGLNDDEQGFYSLKENLHDISQSEAISMLSHIYSN